METQKKFLVETKEKLNETIFAKKAESVFFEDIPLVNSVLSGNVVT